MRPSSRVEQLGTTALLLLAAWLLYRAVAVVTFPYDLVHAFEGNNLYAGWRIAQGLSPYATPTPGGIPPAYPYPPLFFLQAALGVLAFGPDIRVVRGLALLNVLAASWILYREFRRAGWNSRRSLPMAAAAFLYSYWACGSPALGIADSLLYLVVVLALPAVDRAAKGEGSTLLAAFLCILAPMTKQTAAIVPALAGLHLLITAPRKGFAFALGACVASGVLYGPLVLAWGWDAIRIPWLSTTGDPRIVSNLPLRLATVLATFLPFYMLGAWDVVRGRSLGRALRDPLAFVALAGSFLLLPSQALVDPATYYYLPVFLAMLLAVPRWLDALPRVTPWVPALLALHVVALILGRGIFPPAPSATDWKKGAELTDWFERYRDQDVVTDRHVAWALRHNGEVYHDICRMYGQYVRGLPDPWTAYIRDLENHRFGLVASAIAYERKPAIDALENHYQLVHEISSDTSCSYWYRFRMWEPRSIDSGGGTVETSAIPGRA